MNTRVLLMANGNVGAGIAQWLLREHPDDLSMVVTIDQPHLADAASEAGVSFHQYEGPEELCRSVEATGRVDLGILAWWPKIVRSPLLNLPRVGFINTHPSLLPYNRGKHYNFWALVEQAPFGVTLHWVDEGVDTGDLIAQRRIPYGWEDTGETLYHKACEEMVRLFQDTYPAIRTLEVPRLKQDPQRGSFHRAHEIEAASEIDLDKAYTARDLLNLLRARTFVGHPACRFRDGDSMYEARIQINEVP